MWSSLPCWTSAVLSRIALRDSVSVSLCVCVFRTHLERELAVSAFQCVSFLQGMSVCGPELTWYPRGTCTRLVTTLALCCQVGVGTWSESPLSPQRPGPDETGTEPLPLPSPRPRQQKPQETILLMQR